MPNALDEARYLLALANRMVAHEGVLDGFGHISVHHPGDPERYLLARSRSPELIEPSDILEFTLDLQLRSAALGPISPLSKGEAAMACAYSLRERPMGRAWEYWTTRLTKAGELPPRGGKPKPAAKRRAKKPARKIGRRR